MRKFDLCIVTLVCLCMYGDSSGQTPSYFKGLGTATNTIPMNNPGSHCQQIYTPSDFNTVPISGNITKIYFRNSIAGATGTYANFQVSFLQNSLTAFPNTTFLTGFTNALTAASITINGNATAGGWYEIPLAIPFPYDNTQTLIVEIKYTTRVSGGMSGYTTSAVGNKRLSIITAPGPATGNLSTLWGDFGMEVVAAGSCTSPPLPGQATATPGGTVCASAAVNLNVTGNSGGAGQTYRWETSATSGGTYTSVSGVLTAPQFVINPTVSGWYRVAITCGTETRTSLPVEVTVTPGFPGGTYTINSAVATGGNNFQTFAAAVNALDCGIAGPVIFNVAAGSGPYNEQVIIPAVLGTSAVNTITFNGNGRTVTDNGTTVTGQRAVFKLDGADYVTINDFVINTGLGTYGYGVQLLNDADNNTISNNIITSNQVSTSTVNYAGVLINSSASSITGTGSSLSDNNTISGNSIAGGYAGVAIVANGTTSSVLNNKVLNNTITDFHTYGVYMNGNVGTLIEGNDISRPTRTVVGIFYGIYYTGISLNTVANANKMHDPFTGSLASTNAAYGIDHVNCDATAGNENIVSNNLVYNFIGGTGTHNGFLSNNSDYIKYLHNTIALEDVTATCSTCFTRGFYQQGTATGLTYQNNIVTIKRGGTGEKQGIYFEQNTLAGIVLSNNDYYFYPGVGGLLEVAHLGLTGGMGYATIAAWQAGSSQEAGSVSIDPIYTLVGNSYKPTAPVLNNLGTPVGILTDILNLPRSATVPDMGAYEFDVLAGIDMAAIELVSPVVKACYTNETFTVTVKNMSALAVNFSVNNLNVVLNITSPGGPLVFNQAVTSGTLASGATQDIVMGTGVMTPGLWTFNANTVITGDVNPSNDAMTPAIRTVVALAAGTVSVNPTNYCNTGGTPTLTLTGSAGGNIQWQQSTVSNTGPWTNVGTGGSTYTPAAAITATTYYQALVSCGATTMPTNGVTVTLSSPQVLTTTPGTRCGTGTVTLGATGSPGSTLNWYPTLTGGASIGTGSTFVTPSLTTSNTYFVGASVSGSTQQYRVGYVNTAGYVFLTQTAGWGLMFTVNSSSTIDSVYVYPTGTGTISIRILDPSNAVLFTGPTVNISGTGTQKVGVYVGANLVPGSYKMGMASTGVTNLGSQTTGSTMAYPFVSPPLTITSGTQGAGPVAVVYYWFYDWVINASGSCESTRTPVTATVIPAPTATIFYANSPYCVGSASVNVIHSGSTGGTYSASPAGLTLNTTTGAINPATSSPGTYTVTYTIPGTAPCGNFTTTATVIITPVPNATISYTGSPYCNNGVALVTRTGNVGGSYSSTPGLTIDPLSGTVNLFSSTPGTYTVTYNVPAASGCAAYSTTTTITINPLSVAPTGATTSASTICASGNVTLSVVGGTLATGATWRWYSGSCGGTLVGTGAVLNNVAVNANTTFYVRAESSCGVTGCASVSVNVVSPPVVQISASPSTQLSPSLITILTSTVSPVGITATYEWYRDGVLLPNFGGLVDVNSLGDYHLLVRDQNGCVGRSNTLTISAAATSILFITPNPNRGQFQVRYYSQSTPVRKLTIYDSKGARVYERAYTISGPYSGMDVRLSTAGTYTVMLSDVSGNRIAVGQVVVN